MRTLVTLTFLALLASSCLATDQGPSSPSEESVQVQTGTCKDENPSGATYQRRGVLPGFHLQSPPLGRLTNLLRDFQDDFADIFRIFDVASPDGTVQVRHFPGASTTALAVDVHEDDKNVYVTTDIPGIPKSDIKVQVTKDNLLTIEGERKSEQKEEKEGKVFRVERTFGSFHRSLQLPSNVEVAKIRAKVDHGVLTVTVPKTPGQPDDVKQITVE